ncbi:MAG: nucleoside hydrolase [Clostridia bacterium]|nr:nucleoside hydrolase [Clostridia bacterium]
MEKIIIDTDPGVDDVVAILFAVKSRQFDILGITTVNGNCSLENATRNALKTLEMAGENNIPVYAGMDKALAFEGSDASHVHGTNGLGGVNVSDPIRKPEEDNAIDFLIKTVNENPGQITIVPIGPLTNIAKAVLKDANFAKNVKRLVIMGGSSERGNITPTAEFNFYKDPDAAKIVYEAGFKEIITVGLNVTRKVVLNSKLENFLLGKKEDELAKFLYDITRIGAEFDRKAEKVDGVIINDALTVAYLADNHLLELRDAFIEVSINPENIGQSIVDYEFEKSGRKSNAKMAYDVNITDTLKLIFQTIFEKYKDEIDKLLD